MIIKFNQTDKQLSSFAGLDFFLISSITDPELPGQIFDNFIPSFGLPPVGNEGSRKPYG